MIKTSQGLVPTFPLKNLSIILKTKGKAKTTMLTTREATQVLCAPTGESTPYYSISRSPKA
jgi:hypothetical protein